MVVLEPTADPADLAAKIEAQFGLKPSIMDGEVRIEINNLSDVGRVAKDSTVTVVNRSAQLALRFGARHHDALGAFALLASIGADCAERECC